jgi:predicted peptidase
MSGASTNGGTASGGGGGTGGMAIDPNGGAPAGPASGRHTPRPIGSKGDNTAGYWEYLPPHYGNGARYPLLVFRHGIGENGNGTSELSKVVVHGPPKLIEADKWPESRNWIVLSVQHTGDGCATPQETVDFFEFARANYDVDPTRIYLTGLSCGAIGSWDYLGEHTDETVAAAVLICGDGRPAFKKAGCNLGKVPIWAFHGEADPTVDPKGSIDAVASLQACTSPAPVDVKLTTYPGVGHDSWTMTYDLSNPQNDIYAWLASHHK